MTNLKGEVRFAHEGEELTLLFSAAAWIEAEEATGLDLLELVLAEKRLSVQAAVMQAGLKYGCGREISRDQAGQIILDNSPAFNAMRRAMLASLNIDDAGEDEEPGAEQPGEKPEKKSRKNGTGKNC